MLWKFRTKLEMIYVLCPGYPLSESISPQSLMKLNNKHLLSHSFMGIVWWESSAHRPQGTAWGCGHDQVWVFVQGDSLTWLLARGLSSLWLLSRSCRSSPLGLSIASGSSWHGSWLTKEWVIKQTLPWPYDLGTFWFPQYPFHPIHQLHAIWRGMTYYTRM